MGKRAKEHRKKVAARNAKIQSDMKRIEAAVSQFIEQSKKQEEQPKPQTLPFSPQSAIDVALAEKNKLSRN